MSLQGQVALITGGSKGIGRAVAERFAADGASVVISYLSDGAAADEAVSRLGGAEKALAVQADASGAPDLERLVAAAVDRFGRVDVLVANAGMTLMRTVEDASEEDFDSVFALNVKGPFFLVQKALPHMAPGSRVILDSSGIAHLSTISPAYLLHAASKAAVEQMTRIMAKGLAAKGVLVNAVAPGATATDSFCRGKSERALDGIRGMNPFNRIGEPADVADVFAFLAGPDSRWVTGQTLRVDGGMV